MKQLRLIFFICFSLFISLWVMPLFANNNVAPQPRFGRAVQTDQSLNLDNGMFGLTGPFSLGLTYSHQYGVLLSGVVTEAFLKQNAASVAADAGKDEYRGSVTVARALTKQQRVKVTAEYLAQRQDYEFSSGKTDQWVGQNGYGVTYQYLIPDFLVRDVNVNGFYVRAIGKSLSSRDYTQNGLNYRNYRHIAGGVDKSISAGLDLLPLPQSLIGLSVNYDNLHYDGRYESLHRENSTGVGAGITLNQIINKQLQLQLGASDRAFEQTYQAEFDWLLHAEPGAQLVLQLLGSRVIGHAGLSNDTSVGVNVTYNFGGSAIKQPTYDTSFSHTGVLGDLASWTAVPAVDMHQVLAVVDQKSVQLPISGPTPLRSAGAPSQEVPSPNPNYQPFNITYAPGNTVNLRFFGLYFPNDNRYQNGLFWDPAFKIGQTKFTVSGLDGSNITLTQTPFVITYEGNEVYQYTLELKGTIPSDALDHIYHVSIAANNWNGPGTGTQNFNIYVTGKPYMDMNTQKVTYSKVFNSNNVNQYIHPNGGNIVSAHSDKLASQYGMQFQVDANHNVSLVTTSANGVTHLPTFSTQTIDDVIIKNSVNETSTPQSLQIEVAGPPEWQSDPQAQTHLLGDAITPVDFTSHFTLPQNSGAINSWSVAVKDHQGNDISGGLATLGLTFTNGQLTGTLKQDANLVNLSPIAIIATPSNENGSSIDNAGAKKSATFQLTLQPVTSPSIDANTQKFTFHDKSVSDADINQYVHPGSGTVTSISSAKLTSEYGLQFKVDPTTHAVSIVNDSNATNGVIKPTLSDATIDDVAIENSYGKKITNGVFTIQVAGPPVWQSNPAPIQAKVGDKIALDLSSHFAIPQNSAQIDDGSKLVITNASGKSVDPNTLGLHLQGSNGDYQLAGTLTSAAENNTFKIVWTAHNQQGTSIDASGTAKNLDDSIVVQPSPPTNVLYCPAIKDLKLVNGYVEGDSNGVHFYHRNTNENFTQQDIQNGTFKTAFFMNNHQTLQCEYLIKNSWVYIYHQRSNNQVFTKFASNRFNGQQIPYSNDYCWPDSGASLGDVTKCAAQY